MIADKRKTLEIAKVDGQRVPSYSDKFVNSETRDRLEHLVAPHVDSFNYFLEYGLAESIADLPPMEFSLDGGPHIKIQFTGAEINCPTKNDDFSASTNLTPREARERGISYGGSFLTHLIVNVEGHIENMGFSSRFGEMPIMIKSDRCHLRGMSAQKLVYLKEEANEMGGYFITNGIERVIRLLQVPRRNYAAAIERNSFKNRGPSYSDKGVVMRCCRPDQSSVTITLHYLANGGATLKFVARKQEFLLPVVIVAKALAEITDKEFFDRVVQGNHSNTFLTSRLELLLRDAKQYGIFSSAECLAFLGSHFRLFMPISEKWSDEQAGRMLVDRYFFVHVKPFASKLECLLHMLRKLFSFAEGKCANDNADALMNHELLLPGHLINMIVKEKLEEVLLSIKMHICKDFKVDRQKFNTSVKTGPYFQKLFDRYGGGLGSRMATFMSTGNIVSSSGLDLMQVSGYTIVAERLNIFRYMSHFQSVHRGQFFTTMKTTTVRKLLPESWGFLCPVHTPDGSPCGLLNHLAKEAVVIAFPTHERLPTTPHGVLRAPIGPDDRDDWAMDKSFKKLLSSVGIIPLGTGGGDGQLILGPAFIPVLIDGVVFGGMKASRGADIVAQLRLLKVTGGTDTTTRIDPTTELAFFPYSALGGAYAGLYIFTQPGRLIRPVLSLKTRTVEWIGPMEQVFMDIACLAEDRRAETTHMELGPGIMLSQVASMTPFSDYNQSPRNMYQCQMGKQTMGTPAHAMKYRSDNKLYRIQSGQAPLVQTQAHRDYCMDEYPQGTNAVVAVIAYTGYDMEDAMIISKGSYQRGFGHGSVYKTAVIDLEDEEKRPNKTGGKPKLRFSNIKSCPGDPGNDSDMIEKWTDELDLDGLPFEGEVMEYGKPMCCLIDSTTGEHRVIKHKDHEKAYVDTVRIIGSAKSVKGGDKVLLRKVSITLRYPRSPVIGDKFSSRHGQKGTLSVLWPQENMPFSESGMSPDVLINPHAFPSRMTIGMLIESMAGKSGAMHGIYQDATPFQFHEENRAIDYMGAQLAAAGYNYCGSEPLYSGVTGKVMQAEIFVGVVYYQRLRHMVSDKSQARSTGPVMAITRQPVKGRKKHGGIRLGEMERDALLSHGVAFCLHDRLMNCSDNHLAYVCSNCGGLLSVYSQMPEESVKGGLRRNRAETCKTCQSSASVKAVYLPYVYRYLTNELAAMGIKLTLTLADQ